MTPPPKKGNFKKEEKEEADVCPICHENLDNGQLTISLTNCGHVFHEDCITHTQKEYNVKQSRLLGR